MVWAQAARHCVSKEWAKPLLQAGCQNPEQHLSQMSLGFPVASGPQQRRALLIPLIPASIAR